MIPAEIERMLLAEDFGGARVWLAASGVAPERARLLGALVALREGWSRAEIHRPRPPEEVKPLIRERADAAIETLSDGMGPEADAWAAWLLAESYCLRLSLGSPIDVLKLGVRVGALYEKAARALPSSPDVLVSWGAYGKLNAPLTFGGGPKSAAVKIEAALALDPGRADAHALLGVCRLRDKDPAGARACLERALSLAPHYAYAQRVLDHVLGTAAAKEKA